jgi:hypothetical protein
MTPSGRQSRRNRALHLGDRRIRTKLSMILALPVTVIVVLAGMTIASAVADARRADQARLQMALAGTAGGLAAALQQERATAELLFTGRSADVAAEEFGRRIAATDAAAAVFRRQAELVGPSPETAAAAVNRVAAQLQALAGIRQQALTSPQAVGSVIAFRYRAVIADLLTIRQGVTQIGLNPDTANEARASSELSQAVEALGLMQVAVTRAIGTGRLTPAAQQDVVAAHTRTVEALQTFQDLAPARWRWLLNNRVSGGDVQTAERLRGAVIVAAPDTELSLGVDARAWSAAVGKQMELMHTVERVSDTDLLAAVTRQRDALYKQIGVRGAAVLLCLIAMIALAWWVARSLARSLTRLRQTATEVAEEHLPQMVRLIGSVDTRNQAAVDQLLADAAAPIRVSGTDEIAQVAATWRSVRRGCARSRPTSTSTSPAACSVARSR